LSAFGQLRNYARSWRRTDLTRLTHSGSGVCIAGDKLTVIFARGGHSAGVARHIPNLIVITAIGSLSCVIIPAAAGTRLVTTVH
jgi:hypothetical protein